MKLRLRKHSKTVERLDGLTMKWLDGPVFSALDKPVLDDYSYHHWG